ncbi:type VII secretion target [Saccharopolyspora sp. CA-218241]|uniref:type VII secretion target n=1 Tax=Saccharopolyspora sp. CA-218241 TaxID=3240027 RepID=UPI003D9903FD
MGEFKADPASIGEFGVKLEGMTGDAEQAKAYVDKWISFGYSEGRMFATAVEAAEEARTMLTENYRKLAEVQRGAAEEVGRTAKFYERTDREQAERLDRSYD